MRLLPLFVLEQLGDLGLDPQQEVVWGIGPRLGGGCLLLR
jgi:hypothetical protein